MFDWVVFNCVVPLLPVPFVYFGAFLIDKPKKIVSIIKDGQLCFYYTALLAGCIDDIVKSKVALANHLFGVAVAGLIVTLLFSTFIFGVANDIGRSLRWAIATSGG